MKNNDHIRHSLYGGSLLCGLSKQLLALKRLFLKIEEGLFRIHS